MSTHSNRDPLPVSGTAVHKIASFLWYYAQRLRKEKAKQFFERLQRAEKPISLVPFLGSQLARKRPLAMS